jgi:hypothetical protein
MVSLDFPALLSVTISPFHIFPLQQMQSMAAKGGGYMFFDGTLVPASAVSVDPLI